MSTAAGAFYYPPLENLPTFDVLVFRNAQDVVDYATSAGNATTVSVADTDAATTFYPVFTSTGAGQKALLFDTITTPLSYVPSTSTLTATNFNGNATSATKVNLSSAATGTTYLVMSSVTASSTADLFTDNGGASYDTATNTADINITANAGSATEIALTSDDSAGTFYIPYSKTISGISNKLYIDTTTTPLTYNPNTSTLTVSSYGLRTTIPSTISGSGTNIDIINNNAGGVITINNDLSFTSTSDGNRQINNTYYNLNDTSAVAGGAAQGRIYSDTANTYIEGFVGTHNIIGTENSTASSRQLFNFGSSSADLYPVNIRLGPTNAFNIGSGAGSISNLIIGSSTPKTIVFTTGNNTFVGTGSGQGATIASTSNTCFGNSSGLGLTSGTQNTFIGALTGFQTANGAGSFNTCVGMYSGDSMTTTANGNTTYGYNSGASITTGTNNTVIGISNAATLTTGSNNIVIGNAADVLTAAAANVIAIGTTAETMFIQGGFNYRIGSNISATVTLSAPLAQFYSVAMTAATQTITLPAPSSASVKGAYVVFKRKTNTTYSFTIGAGANSMMPVNSITSAATVTISTATFNCELICDGVYWSVIQQA